MMFSRKVWEVGPCPWRTVEKKKESVSRERAVLAEAIAELERVNRETRKMAKAVKEVRHG